MLFKIDVFFKLSQNSQENTCIEVSFVKVATLLKRLQHWGFPLNISKFLRTGFFIEHFWWLLLTMLQARHAH